MRPIERFLGEEFAGGGPFVLLGVTPEACSEDLVLSGLDRQIEKISEHPEADTPEADEVRLALHAAAAQLLDPVVRRHLIARWTGVQTTKPAGSAKPSGVAATPPRARVSTPVSTAERLLEADAVLTLGMFGGWNSRSLRRLVALAHARGLNNEQVVRVLRNLSNRRRATPASVTATGGMRESAPLQSLGNAFVPGSTSVLPAAAGGAKPPTPGTGFAGVTQAGARGQPRPEAKTASSKPSEEERDPAAQLVKQALVYGGVGVVTLGSLLLGVFLLTRDMPAPAGPPGPGAGAPVAAGSTVPAASPEQNPERVAQATPNQGETPKPTRETASKPKPATAIAPGDPILILRELASVSEAATVSPEDAASRFEQVVPKLASIWTTLPPDRQIASTDSILEYLYKVSGTPELGMRAVDAVAQGARPLAGSALNRGQVLPAAWSSGVLVRLAREHDLPSSVKAFIDREASLALGAARPAVDQTFQSGALAAMYLIPHRLTPDVRKGARPDADVDAEAWSAFLKAAHAMPLDRAIKTRVILTGLETLLTAGPEPNESRGVAGVVNEIVAQLPWRKDDESRRWLLRWFADPRVSNADLNAVTSALTTRSAAEGVDLTMVLSTSAAEGVRADLRERYATVWSLQDAVSRDELIAAWGRAARQAIMDSHLAADEVGELASAALLARLNEAAAWHWRGDSGEADGILQFLREPVDLALEAGRSGPTDPGSASELSDGAWGERYLAARQNIKFRRELLNELDVGGEIGAVDAEVLVTEALFGSPYEIRRRAQEVAKRYAERAVVINAVLERLHRAPKIASTGRLIEDIVGEPLPAVRDPHWGLEARRVLVERMLEATAEESPRARIDRLGRVLRMTYRSMAAQAPLSSSERESENQPSAAGSAAHLWTLWRSAADSGVPSVTAPIPLIEVERRRGGRQGQAQGMIQEFAAEQVSLTELLSYLVSMEQSARVADVRYVIEEMTSERRRARHVLRQMNATERAMVRLWMIRFGLPLMEQES